MLTRLSRKHNVKTRCVSTMPRHGRVVADIWSGAKRGHEHDPYVARVDPAGSNPGAVDLGHGLGGHHRGVVCHNGQSRTRCGLFQDSPGTHGTSAQQHGSKDRPCGPGPARSEREGLGDVLARGS